MKGYTRWHLRETPPVRPGEYECFVRICPGGYVIWPEKLYWDGAGFLVPFPMVVKQWRGLTKQGHDAALKAIPAGRT